MKIIDQNLDQGVKFCSNFQSARNATKPIPLRPSRLPDSDGIFTFSNGVRMEKISRICSSSQTGKNFDADCTCPYSPYKTHVKSIQDTWQDRTTYVAGPYRTCGGFRE
jgi:hypothetical protein